MIGAGNGDVDVIVAVASVGRLDTTSFDFLNGARLLFGIDAVSGLMHFGISHQEIRMSELIAILYPRLDRANDVLARLRWLETAHLLRLADACCVTKDADGRIELHQAISTTRRGAVRGALWGSLIGLLFANPLIGLAAGVSAGAVAGAFRDIGISDDLMKQLGRDMPTNSSALFVLVRRATRHRLDAELARFGGRVIHTSLDQAEEAALRRALNEGRPVVTIPAFRRAVATIP